MSIVEQLSLIVSVAGSIAAIASVWFVYRQTRILARQTDYVARSLSTSMAENINSRVEQVTRLFIEYPDMRPYFYKGQPIDESHADYARAEAIAEMLLDSLVATYDVAKRGGELRPGQRGYSSALAYVTDSFAQSPTLCKFLTEHQSWYTVELIELMRQSVSAKGPHAGII